MDTSGRRVDLSKPFEITEEHLKLAKRSFFHHRSDYDYYGAPSVGEKRPYGNSDVVGDILEILGKEGEQEWNESAGYWEYSKELTDFALKLHVEMSTVFQIAACTLKFEVGKYEATDKCDNLSWRKVG